MSTYNFLYTFWLPWLPHNNFTNKNHNMHLLSFTLQSHKEHLIGFNFQHHHNVATQEMDNTIMHNCVKRGSRVGHHIWQLHMHLTSLEPKNKLTLHLEPYLIGNHNRKNHRSSLHILMTKDYPCTGVNYAC